MHQSHRIAIALGANLGDRLHTLRAAAAKISEEVLEEVLTSQVYETPPWGITEQPTFYNAVMTGICDWKPPALLNYLKQLEREMGRVSTVKNGPRVLDLDIIAYGNEIWESEGLSVPHRHLAERDFVLVPLSEIWAEWKHPKLAKTAQELLQEFQKTQPVHARAIAPLLPNTMSPSLEPYRPDVPSK